MHDLRTSLFGPIAAAVGARVTPIDATGAALDAACQALAEIALQQGGPALICAGGRAAQLWQAEVAQPGQHQIFFTGEGPAGRMPAPGIVVSLADTSPATHEYLIVVLAPQLTAVLCAAEHQTAGDDSADQCFTTLWSFEPAVVLRALPVLRALAEQGRPEQQAALAAAFAVTANPAPSPALEHLVRRLFDALNQQHDARIRLERSLARGARLRSIGQMLSGVAHELNNPLQSILGFSTLLVDEPAMPPELQPDLQHIVAAAERARLIVQSVLQVARSADEHFAAVDLNELIAKTLVFMQADLQRADITVEVAVSPQLPPVTVKPFRIQQLLINLISNAAHALSRQGGRRSLRISATTTRDCRCELLVADNGPGIPAAIQQHIFEPFFTTKQAGEGTGLGLSIVKTIVDEHQGTLRLVSAPGSGTTFQILLPIRQAAIPAAPRRRAAGGHGRVLVLDDDQAVRAVIQRTLERAGYEVQALSTLDLGLEAALAEQFDAVLCAVIAPLSRLAAFYAHIAANVPSLVRRLIFTTSDASESATGAFLQRSGCPVLAKPFHPDDLLKAIESVVAAPQALSRRDAERAEDGR